MDFLKTLLVGLGGLAGAHLLAQRQMFFIEDTAPGIGPGNNADRFAIGATVKSESVFAVIQVN